MLKILPCHSESLDEYYGLDGGGTPFQEKNSFMLCLSVVLLVVWLTQNHGHHSVSIVCNSTDWGGLACCQVSFSHLMILVLATFGLYIGLVMDTNLLLPTLMFNQ